MILQNSRFGKRGKNWYILEFDFVSDVGGRKHSMQTVGGELSTHAVCGDNSTYTDFS
jgi:hypothetical protein